MEKRAPPGLASEASSRCSLAPMAPTYIRAGSSGGNAQASRPATISQPAPAGVASVAPARSGVLPLFSPSPSTHLASASAAENAGVPVTSNNKRRWGGGGLARELKSRKKSKIRCCIRRRCSQPARVVPCAPEQELKRCLRVPPVANAFDGSVRRFLPRISFLSEHLAAYLRSFVLASFRFSGKGWRSTAVPFPMNLKGRILTPLAPASRTFLFLSSPCICSLRNVF